MSDSVARGRSARIAPGRAGASPLGENARLAQQFPDVFVALPPSRHVGDWTNRQRTAILALASARGPRQV